MLLLLGIFCYMSLWVIFYDKRVLYIYLYKVWLINNRSATATDKQLPFWSHTSLCAITYVKFSPTHYLIINVSSHLFWLQHLFGLNSASVIYQKTSVQLWPWVMLLKWCFVKFLQDIATEAYAILKEVDGHKCLLQTQVFEWF